MKIVKIYDYDMITHQRGKGFARCLYAKNKRIIIDQNNKVSIKNVGVKELKKILKTLKIDKVMVKQANAVETIGGQTVQVNYDLENEITTLTVNLNTGTTEAPENNTLQLVKQLGKVTTRLTGSAPIKGAIADLEEALRVWLENSEPGIVAGLKSY